MNSLGNTKDRKIEESHHNFQHKILQCSPKLIGKIVKSKNSTREQLPITEIKVWHNAIIVHVNSFSNK